MKIIQLNIWQGRILKHVSRFLQEQQPDIICLQEVYSSKNRIPDWDNFSSLEILQETLPHLKHWFFAPLFSFDVRGRQVTNGNLIASRFPLSDENIMFTHGQYAPDGDAPPNTRNLQSCKVSLDTGATFSLLNHHAYTDKTPDGNETSVRSMSKVIDVVKKLPQPIIVCGDMNVRSESETMQLFTDVLEDLSATHKLETTLTRVGAALDHDNMVVCDHVLVSPEIVVNSFSASDDLVSDHKALILDFDLK